MNDVQLSSADVNDKNSAKKMSSTAEKETRDRLEVENKVGFVMLANIAKWIFQLNKCFNRSLEIVNKG